MAKLLLGKEVTDALNANLQTRTAALREKGVSREVIEEAMEECCDGDAAQEAIRELLRKRRYDPDTASPEETRKTLAYLMRKGFRYDDVRQVIQVSEWNA